MKTLRHYIKLVEQAQQITEINRGVSYDDNWDEVKSQHRGPNPDQGELFPHLGPGDYHVLGKMGRFIVALLNRSYDGDVKNRESDQYKTYMVFDGETPVGYMVVGKPPHGPWMGYSTGRVSSVKIDDSYRGKGIGLQLYAWLLANVYTFLVSDDDHTDEGAQTWIRMVKSKQFTVYTWDNWKDYGAPYEVKTTKGLEKVYRWDGKWVLFVTLRHDMYQVNDADERSELIRLALLKARNPSADYEKRIREKVATLSDDEVQKHLAMYRKNINFDDY